MGLGRSVTGVALRGARRRWSEGTVSDVAGVARRYRIDPDWKRTSPDGYAARLDTVTTIGVTKPVGRWRRVDPRVPQDAWRAPWKAAGLVVWGAAVGAAWWMGSSRGRGPLGMLHDDHERPW